MNIKDFKNYIDKTILNRGYDYYNNGNIVESYKRGDNEYIFEIEGSEDYQVVVEINENGEILDSYCNCPYDFGPTCKHEVAAYFELVDILNDEGKKQSIKKESSKKLVLKDVLDNLSKEELISIIIDLSKKDSTLKESLIFKHSKGDANQELKKCKNLIDSIVNKYIKRGHFISYDETYDFINDIEEILEKVRNTEDSLLALDFAFLLLNEAIEAFQYADDSDGYIGSLVTDTLETISDIVNNSDDFYIRKEMFNKLLQMSESKVFNEWEEYKHDIFRICLEFADDEELRKKLVMKIEHVINKSSFDNDEYRVESLFKILFHIINQYGTKEDADEFIKDNLNFTFFRELLINKYIEDRNYNEIIKLALEGEDKDKRYMGLVLKWKKLRYVSYKELSLKNEQEKLAKELLLRGDFEYYKELKELAKDDITSFYNNLKSELKNYKGWHGQSIYLKIIVAENDLDEIMEYVRENPRSIEEYAKLLIDKFRDEVNEIYIKYIKLLASSASNRSGYKGVCWAIKGGKDICGNKNIKELINELTALYKRRPAFLEELSKIK